MRARALHSGSSPKLQKRLSRGGGDEGYIPRPVILNVVFLDFLYVMICLGKVHSFGASKEEMMGKMYQN